jgi:hypothetical protein
VAAAVEEVARDLVELRAKVNLQYKELQTAVAEMPTQNPGKGVQQCTETRELAGDVQALREHVTVIQESVCAMQTALLEALKTAKDAKAIARRAGKVDLEDTVVPQPRQLFYEETIPVVSPGSRAVQAPSGSRASPGRHEWGSPEEAGVSRTVKVGPGMVTPVRGLDVRNPGVHTPTGVGELVTPGVTVPVPGEKFVAIMDGVKECSGTQVGIVRHRIQELERRSGSPDHHFHQNRATSYATPIHRGDPGAGYGPPGYRRESPVREKAEPNTKLAEFLVACGIASEDPPGGKRGPPRGRV